MTSASHPSHDHAVDAVMEALAGAPQGLMLSELLVQLHTLEPAAVTSALDAEVAQRRIVFTAGQLDDEGPRGRGLRFHKAAGGIPETRSDPALIKDVFRLCETDMGRGEHEAMRQAGSLIRALCKAGHPLEAVEKALLELVSEQILTLFSRADGYMVFWIKLVTHYTVILHDLFEHKFAFFEVRAGTDQVAREKALVDAGNRLGTWDVIAVTPGIVPLTNGEGNRISAKTL